MTKREKRTIARRWNQMYAKFRDGLTKQEEDEYRRALYAERNRSTPPMTLGGPG